MMNMIKVFLLALICFVKSINAEEVRGWTRMSDGKVITASLKSQDRSRGIVTITSKGKDYTLKVSVLSDEDRTYLKNKALELFIGKNELKILDDRNWQALSLKRSKIETVRFRSWLPREVKVLRGTLILVPGVHGDGRPLADTKYWQNVAEDLEFAIVACQFTDGDQSAYQSDEGGEISESLNVAVEYLSLASDHPELAFAPLALWGTSAGSNVSSKYCKKYPERVLAFASSKGTWGPGRGGVKDSLKVPMVFAVGGKDNPVWIDSSVKNIEKARNKGSLWTLALNEEEGHAIGESLKMIAVFFKEISRMRLDYTNEALKRGSSKNGFIRCSEIKEKDGFLGDPETKEVFTYSEYSKKKSAGIWLPTVKFSEAWKDYVK